MIGSRGRTGPLLGQPQCQNGNLIGLLLKLPYATRALTTKMTVLLTELTQAYPLKWWMGSAHEQTDIVNRHCK